MLMIRLACLLQKLVCCGQLEHTLSFSEWEPAGRFSVLFQKDPLCCRGRIHCMCFHIVPGALHRSVPGQVTANLDWELQQFGHSCLTALKLGCHLVHSHGHSRVDPAGLPPECAFLTSETPYQYYDNLHDLLFYVHFIAQLECCMQVVRAGQACC